MLAIVLGGLGILAVCLTVGAIVAACGSNKVDQEEDVASQPPEPECDEHARAEDESNIDQQSFDAMKNLWGEKFDEANAESWHRHTRIYFGATAPLFKTTCEDEALKAGPAGEYMGEVSGFFEDYYSTKANSLDDGVLVLIGGLAPADVEDFGEADATVDPILEKGIDAMAAADVTQGEFANLLKACYWYNLAAVKANDKYSDPSGKTFSKKDKALAMAYLSNAENILNRFNEMDEADLNEALDDRQQELLFALGEAVKGYAKTLTDTDWVPPKCKLKPKDCKKEGKVLDKVECECVKEEEVKGPLEIKEDNIFGWLQSTPNVTA